MLTKIAKKVVISTYHLNVTLEHKFSEELLFWIYFITSYRTCWFITTKKTAWKGQKIEEEQQTSHYYDYHCAAFCVPLRKWSFGTLKTRSIPIHIWFKAFCNLTFSPTKFFKETVYILKESRYSGIWKDVQESGKILRNL